MATSEDEASLLAVWNKESLGQYEGQWIAWRGGVQMSHAELSAMTNEFRSAIQQGNGPLFAFVSFKVRA